MTRGEARTVLEQSAAMKLVVPRDDGRQAKIDALEDYVLASAGMQADLSAARGAAQDRLAVNERAWRDVTGWEPFRQGKTDQSIDLAKRHLKPDEYEELEEDRHLIRRLSAEIERLEADYAKASRAYTMLQGA